MLMTWMLGAWGGWRHCAQLLCPAHAGTPSLLSFQPALIVTRRRVDLIIIAAIGIAFILIMIDAPILLRCTLAAAMRPRVPPCLSRVLVPLLFLLQQQLLLTLLLAHLHCLCWPRSFGLALGQAIHRSLRSSLLMLGLADPLALRLGFR